MLVRMEVVRAAKAAVPADAEHRGLHIRQIAWPWAQVMIASRRRSACASKSWKMAPTHPVAAPTIKAVPRASTGCDVRPPFVDGRLFGPRLVCRSSLEGLPMRQTLTKSLAAANRVLL